MVLEWQNPALIGCRTTFNVWGRETRALINVAVVVGKCFFCCFCGLYSDLPGGEVTKCAGTIADDKEEPVS